MLQSMGSQRVGYDRDTELNRKQETRRGKLHALRGEQSPTEGKKDTFSFLATTQAMQNHGFTCYSFTVSFSLL